MRLDYDLDANALYIRVSDDAVSKTENIDDETLVDVGANGAVVGIEVIGLGREWPLGQVLSRYPLAGNDVRQLEALFPFVTVGEPEPVRHLETHVSEPVVAEAV
ncbi:DUF2283 domain-containing protein [Microtetraspora malaysiensis]|uniref:DUF2283 domain-containing protein n=1 Tax=Microtetraspora malaysiensis TaxID=161358 RepID=UPI003D8D75F1